MSVFVLCNGALDQMLVNRTKCAILWNLIPQRHCGRNEVLYYDDNDLLIEVLVPVFFS